MNRDEALRCAILCNNVYYNIKDIQNTGMATWYYCAQSNTLCFRGSDDRVDWLFNSSFETWNYAGAQGHRGFFDIFRGAENEVQKLLEDLPLETLRNITLTGHSMGSSLAMICALHIWNRYKFAPTLFSFGGPKVFVDDQLNVQQALLHCNRFINRYDVVPHLPLGIYYGYAHYGKEYWLNKPRVPLLPALAGAVGAKAFLIDDHYIQKYMDAINKLI